MNKFLLRLSLTILLIAPVLLTAQHNRRFVAEWEPAWGTLIRWPLGIPSALVVELASDDSLYVLVANESQKQQAIATFSAWNVNMNHCRFILAPTNSHWTRDWGPHYVFNEQGVGGIADPIFDGYPWVPGCYVSTGEPENIFSDRSGNQRYALDNLVNGILADTFNVPLISLPIYLTGGNVMVDGRRTAVATQQMLDENFPGINEEQFRQIAAESLGITNFIIVDNPEVNGIQHIDCYAKFLSEETIMVKAVDPWHPEYNCCEVLADHLGSEMNAFGEPYNIVRIHCGTYSGQNAAAFTNSLILNNKVLVPLFGILEDEQALQVYRDAMPGYEVIGFPWSAWYHYDALHCRTMGIFDRFMLRIEHKPLRGEKFFADLPKISAIVDNRSETGLVEDGLKLYFREKGQLSWSHEQLTPLAGTDSLHAFIPNAELQKEYDYYIAAADNSGRQEFMPRTAPSGFYTFKYTGTYTGTSSIVAQEMLRIEPSLFSEVTSIRLQIAEGPARLSIWSTNGEKLMEWQGLQAGTEIIQWNGTDKSGSLLPAGVYIIRLEGNGFAETKKCVLVR